MRIMKLAQPQPQATKLLFFPLVAPASLALQSQVEFSHKMRREKPPPPLSGTTSNAQVLHNACHNRKQPFLTPINHHILTSVLPLLASSASVPPPSQPNQRTPLRAPHQCPPVLYDPIRHPKSSEKDTHCRFANMRYAATYN
jgi:hypothetical protein